MTLHEAIEVAPGLDPRPSTAKQKLDRSWDFVVFHDDQHLGNRCRRCWRRDIRGPNFPVLVEFVPNSRILCWLWWLHILQIGFVGLFDRLELLLDEFVLGLFSRCFFLNSALVVFRKIRYNNLVLCCASGAFTITSMEFRLKNASVSKHVQ